MAVAVPGAGAVTLPEVGAPGRVETDPGFAEGLADGFAAVGTAAFVFSLEQAASAAAAALATRKSRRFNGSSRCDRVNNDRAADTRPNRGDLRAL